MILTVLVDELEFGNAGSMGKVVQLVLGIGSMNLGNAALTQSCFKPLWLQPAPTP